MVLKTFFINFSKVGSMWPFGVRLNLQPVIFRFHIHNVFGFHLNMNMNMKKSVTDRRRSVTLFLRLRGENNVLYWLKAPNLTQAQFFIISF